MRVRNVCVKSLYLRKSRRISILLLVHYLNKQSRSYSCVYFTFNGAFDLFIYLFFTLDVTTWHQTHSTCKPRTGIEPGMSCCGATRQNNTDRKTEHWGHQNNRVRALVLKVVSPCMWWCLGVSFTIRYVFFCVCFFNHSLFNIDLLKWMAENFLARQKIRRINTITKYGSERRRPLVLRRWIGAKLEQRKRRVTDRQLIIINTWRRTYLRWNLHLVSWSS